MAKKKLTEFQLDCPSGSKARVFQTGESRYMGHCASRGCLTFFDNGALLMDKAAKSEAPAQDATTPAAEKELVPA